MARGRYVGLVLGFALVMAGLCHDAASARRFARADVGSWGHGSWCWFADPRAVRVDGPHPMTFVGWLDWQGAVTVGAYDDRSGQMRTRIVGWLFHDDHSSPSLLVEPDGRLTVFWSAHNGHRLYLRTTRQSEDIRRWGPLRIMPSSLRGRLGFTYPNPVRLAGEHNRVFLFWRGENWDADYTTRAAGGRWGRAGELIVNPGQRPYVKVDSDGRRTIAFAFTGAHPRDALTSVYFMTLRGGWLQHANGRLIGRLRAGPIRPWQADLVYDARRTHVSAWVWDVALGRTGHPVIVYATFPSSTDHLYWYARWTGRRWVNHFLTAGGPTISPRTIEGQYSGGLTLDHGDPSTVYLSRKVEGWFEIERWHTSDGGYHWGHRTVVRTPGSDDVRPVFVHGARGGPMSLLWLGGHYGSYSNYRTSVEFLR